MSPKKERRTAKEQLIHETAENLWYREDVVREIVTEFLRILRREIISRGEMHLRGLFTIKTVERKLRRDREDYSDISGENARKETERYLSVSLPRGLRQAFQDKHHPQKKVERMEDNPFLMDDDEEAVQETLHRRRQKSTHSPQDSSQGRGQGRTHREHSEQPQERRAAQRPKMEDNPFLMDDDDED